MSTLINTGVFPNKPKNIKMTDTTWNYVYSGLRQVMVAHNIHPYMVNNLDRAQQIFRKANMTGVFDIHRVYENEGNPINDDNISAALKAMFKR